MVSKANEAKTVHFLGEDRAYDYVHDYYEMVRNAYKDYLNKQYDTKLTPAKKMYIIALKKKVDGVAAILGLEARMSLPDGLTEKYRPGGDELEKIKEQEDGYQSESGNDTGIEGIPGDVRGRAQKDTVKRKPKRR